MAVASTSVTITAQRISSDRYLSNTIGSRHTLLAARFVGCCRLPTGRSHLMGSCFSSGEMKAPPQESWSSAYGQIGNSGALYEPGRPPKYRNLSVKTSWGKRGGPPLPR